MQTGHLEGRSWPGEPLVGGDVRGRRHRRGQPVRLALTGWRQLSLGCRSACPCLARHQLSSARPRGICGPAGTASPRGVLVRCDVPDLLCPRRDGVGPPEHVLSSSPATLGQPHAALLERAGAQGGRAIASLQRSGGGGMARPQAGGQRSQPVTTLSRGSCPAALSRARRGDRC